MAVVRPTASKMEHLSHYLSFQAACVNNFSQQLFPERAHPANRFSHSPSSQDRKCAVNIESMLTAIANHGLFHDKTENNSLCNIFKSLQTNNEQAHDLLQFRVIGQSGYEAYINTKPLTIPSTAAPVRRKCLCTFSSSQAERRQIKQADKEAKTSQRYLKKNCSKASRAWWRGKRFGNSAWATFTSTKSIDGYPRAALQRYKDILP